MAKVAFLFLVVLGALAAILGLVLGLGLVQSAGLDAGPAAPPTDAPPLVASSTQPATRSTRPTTRPNAGDAADPDDSNRPEPLIFGPRALPVPVVVNIPGLITLRAADAKLTGPNLRHLPPDNDIGFWDEQADFASWLFTPASGVYHVDVIYSGAAGSGGKYSVWTGRQHDPRGGRLDAVATPTGGWNDYKTLRVGRIALDGKPTVLEVRPSEPLKQTLMNLRRVELVPVTEAELKANPDGIARKPVPADGPPKITGLTMVEVATGRVIGPLKSGAKIDFAAMPPFTVKAEVSGNVQSVQFIEDGKEDRPPESNEPFTLTGIADGKLVPWRPEPRLVAIYVTPYTEPKAGGIPGARYKVRVYVRNSTPIELSPAEATLRGRTFRLEYVREPILTQWTQLEDYAEWPVSLKYSCRFRVEVLASCEAGGGGQLEARLGDTVMPANVAPGTNGWFAIGEASLEKGKYKLSIRPVELTPGKPLMTLRMVRLVPIAEPVKDEPGVEDDN